MSRAIDHDGGSQPFGRHFAHHGVEIGRERHGRRGIARAHHIGHGGEQLASQCAAGVGAGKIVGLEAAGIQQGHGQGIAHGDLHRGAGRGCQVQGAGFFFHAAVQHGVGVTG